MNKTAAEITAAYQAGQDLRCVVPVEENPVTLPLVSVQNDDGRITYVFGGSATWLCASDEVYNVSADLFVDGDAVTVHVQVSPGSSGNSGEDGGYYTHMVTDSGDGTVAVSFAPSKADMPAVVSVAVVLPEGQDGYSPTANVTQTDGGAIIHIFDKHCRCYR